jgi:predicted O-linked N-acetylglucosamine transferase (SPINDLY family)
LDQIERIVADSRRTHETSTALATSSGAATPAMSSPSDADVRGWVEQALALQRERRMPEAMAQLERAANARPMSAEIWNHLGNALQDAGRQEQALDYYRRAAAADPRFGPALQNLGYVSVAQGFTDEGVAWLKEAQRVQPAHVNHVLIATALPVVYESLEDLRARRKRLEDDVQRLADGGLTIDTTRTLIPTNFFAVYQGENDRTLHANLGRIYRGVELCEARAIDPGNRSVRKSSSRPRLGLLSAYFRDHTIGRLNIGRVEKLPRDQFELVVLSVGDHQDPLADRFRRAAEHFVVVPRDVATARTLIHQQQLDALLFTDVGMDALTYTLAFSRMAPVQLTTWGHPVTTGSPTMDYFLSSQLLETPAGDEHYTERLVRLPSLGTYYYRPQLASGGKRREQFGFSADDHVYLCPQTLFKFHPDFDPLLAEILRRDPRGRLALIEGRTANWTRQLQARFARTMPDIVDRIRWMPALPNEDFLQLLAASDVMLDPPHFGGGNTSYEAFAVSLPIVTLPGKFLRSRITQALYSKMGVTELIAEDPAAYVKIAVQAADDADFRQFVRERLNDQSSILFEDAAEISDFAAFLSSLVN